MRRHIIQSSIALLLIIAPVGNACAFLEPALPLVEPEEILIDIWVSDEYSPQPMHISLSINTDGEPWHEVTVIEADGNGPWWTDRVIVTRTHRGIEIVRSMARIVWKIAIRVAPVPAIF